MGLEWTRQNVIERFRQALEKAEAGRVFENITKGDNGLTPGKRATVNSKKSVKGNAALSLHRPPNDPNSGTAEKEFSAKKEM